MTRDALCLRDQPASNRILQSICRLFFGAFARADRVVKQTSLPPMLRLAQLLYRKGLPVIYLPVQIELHSTWPS
jgi:hypothetical protein